MSRAATVLVDPLVTVERLARALATAGLQLQAVGNGLRILPAPLRAPLPCADPGCTRPAGVRDPDSGALLCETHALDRLTAGARGVVANPLRTV